MLVTGSQGEPRAALLPDDAPTIEAAADRLKLSNADRARLLLAQSNDTGSERIVFDGDPRAVEDEPSRLSRKASIEEDAAGRSLASSA